MHTRKQKCKENLPLMKKIQEKEYTQLQPSLQASMDINNEEEERRRRRRRKNIRGERERKEARRRFEEWRRNGRGVASRHLQLLPNFSLLILPFYTTHTSLNIHAPYGHFSYHFHFFSLLFNSSSH